MSERKELLEEVVAQAKESHTWMLENIKHKAMETNGDNFSDELKHAILVQELLENV